MNKLSTIKELKSFLLLWSSQTVSELGTAMTDYALIIWAYQKTGMASSVTLLTFCAFLPTILFRFIAVVNLLAKLGNDGLLAPFILGNSGHVFHRRSDRHGDQHHASEEKRVQGSMNLHSI